MSFRKVLPWLVLTLATFAQVPPSAQPHPRPGEEEEVRLPNGKLQKDEIVRAEFQKSLEDARELSRLADELKVALEKNDRYVLSIPALKKTEEISKLAKRIHDRMKHY